MTTIDKLPKEPGLYIPGHALPGSAHTYRIFQLNNHGEWSEKGQGNQGHDATVRCILDSWLPLARLGIVDQGLAVPATSQNENPLLKHIRSFLRGTVGGNNLARSIFTGDEDAAVTALNIASSRINEISAGKAELERTVRQLETEKKIVQNFFGVGVQQGEPRIG